MKVSRRGRLWGVLSALAAVSALALVAAGCGSSSPSSTASTTPSASASSAATVTVAGVAIKADPALHQLLPASILSAGQIRAASDIPFPPWEMYVGNTTKVTGFDYDLSQAIGAVLGIKVSFNEAPFATIILSVVGGKNDMIMSDMGDTTAREKQVTYVDYADDAESVLVLKGNPQGVTTLNSLAGRTVACEAGTTEQTILQSLNGQFKTMGKKQMRVLVLPNQPACLLAVKSGRAVGDMTDTSTAVYIAKTTGKAAFEVVEPPGAPNGFKPLPIGIGIPKTHTQLITAVQKALQELINNGAYKTIIDKYGLLPVTSAQLNVAAQQASASPTP